MNESWLSRPCSSCRQATHYLPQWNAPPTLCHHCRLRRIMKPVELLYRFMNHEEKVRHEFRSQTDQALFNARSALRNKVDRLLCSFEKVPRQLVAECAKDHDLRTLLQRMDRDRRRSQEPKYSGERTLPKTVTRFVQGGLPGLGKRS